MKNLIPPTLSANDVYTAIKDRCRSEDKIERLERLEQHVFQRYLAYESIRDELEQITATSITDEEDILALGSCYTRSKTGYLEGYVVSRIISIQNLQHKNKCPYCGIDKPRTIDHYLPKNDFPEFSVLPINLIPCCGHCNSKKNDRWLNHGQRMFINFYYDILPPIKFLYADINFDARSIPIVTFRLVNDGSINSAIFDLIMSHYSHLGLLAEYAEIVDEELDNIRDKIIHDTAFNANDYLSSLQVDLASMIRKYGVNYWKAALYDAIISNPYIIQSWGS